MQIHLTMASPAIPFHKLSVDKRKRILDGNSITKKHQSDKFVPIVEKRDLTTVICLSSKPDDFSLLDEDIEIPSSSESKFGDGTMQAQDLIDFCDEQSDTPLKLGTESNKPKLDEIKSDDDEEEEEEEEEESDDEDLEVEEEESEEEDWNIDNLTDEELLSPLNGDPEEKAKALRVIDTLRKYIKQVNESDGFDIVDYPGYIFSFTTIIPQVCSREHNPVMYQRFEQAATMGIAQYNNDHPETEFEIVDVVKASVRPCMLFCDCYVTFTARDKKQQQKTEEAPLKTFQALVEVNKPPLLPGQEPGHVDLIRVKA